MTTKALTRGSELLPTFFEDFFRPWNEWYDGGLARTLTIPSVNIIENKDDFSLSLAVPGMKKDDFKIEVSGNILTISCEKEEKKKEKEKNGRYSREEYNYSSFSRSFTLPEYVNDGKIDAHYQDGVLTVTVPKKEEAKKVKANKQITVK